MNSTERSVVQEQEAIILDFVKSSKYQNLVYENQIEFALKMKLQCEKEQQEQEDRNKKLLKDIIEIINQDCFRVSKDGHIVWRSGMDAGSPPPGFLGRDLQDMLCEWAVEFGYEG